ncbi:MAG: fimbrial protein [Stenotrophomonas maltophilia]
MSNRLNLIAAGALALALSPTAFAETLEITGELMTSTCSVDASGGTITVPMGKVDVASVNASERAGMKNFSILLDCTGAGAAQDVGVRFGGTPDGSTGNLALTAASTATNVGVALYDASGNHQKLGDDPLQWVNIPRRRQGPTGLQRLVFLAGQERHGRHGQRLGRFRGALQVTRACVRRLAVGVAYAIGG